MDKPFIIKCPKCRWSERSQGTKDSLSHLREIKGGCSSCGKKRKFRCPKCGSTAVMLRIFSK